jgi:hypothetical protein
MDTKRSWILAALASASMLLLASTARAKPWPFKPSTASRYRQLAPTRAFEIVGVGRLIGVLETGSRGPNGEAHFTARHEKGMVKGVIGGDQMGVQAIALRRPPTLATRLVWKTTEWVDRTPNSVALPTAFAVGGAIPLVACVTRYGRACFGGDAASSPSTASGRRQSAYEPWRRSSYESQ